MNSTLELMERLKASNELLRSAMQIAVRGGVRTNWAAFKKNLLKELETQHAMLYPETNSYEN